MTVYGLYVKYPKGLDMREVTELIGLFTTKELAEKMLLFWKNCGNDAEIKPITVIDNLDWLNLDK